MTDGHRSRPGPRRAVPVLGLALLLAMATASCSGGSSKNRNAPGPVAPQPDRYELNNARLDCTPVVLDFTAQGPTLHNALDVDFFCFPVAVESDVTATVLFDASVGPVAAELLDETGSTVAASSPIVGGEELTVLMLACGEYALRLWSPTGASIAYDLTIVGAPGAAPLTPDVSEPDDTPAECTMVTDPRLGVVNLPGLTLHDGLNEDWTCFPLGGTADIEVSIVALSTAGAIQAELLDSSLNVIASGVLFNAIIPAGSYFIRVYPDNCGRVSYSMTISEV